MPTPLMPDEEFDAQFRLGLEHYPALPEDPAAWHRMSLLLDADLRQQALRRRVLRLFGAEALLLLVGMWALLSFLPAPLPMAAGRQPLAKTARAGASTAPAGGAGRTLILQAPTPGRTGVAPSPVARRHTLLAAPARSRRPPGAVSAASRAAAGAGLFPAGAHAGERRYLPKAGASPATHNRRAGGGSLPRLATESPTTDKQVAAANKLAFHSKHRLNRLAEHANKALLAAGGQKTRRGLATASPKKAFHQAHTSLALRRRPATQPPAAVSGAAASAAAPSANLPIALLAPRWPGSGLSFRLPDSLALLALALPTHPADSLGQPKPRPLLSAYRLRVGLVGAPELSTVRAGRLSKPGSSLGVQLEYQLGRRWRVSAGYLYTTKIYVARGTDYTLPAGYTMPHGYVISSVDAACRIVDIPLNLRYDLWQRPRYQVFASVGLSSLLMRREQYTYDYELVYGKPVAPYSWELANGSQHVLKVLNLSAGYERAVGPRWTVQAEPFVKLPLAGVGFGAVRLRSAGVFFSLKYGLRPVLPAPAPR